MKYQNRQAFEQIFGQGWDQNEQNNIADKNYKIIAEEKIRQQFAEIFVDDLVIKKEFDEMSQEKIDVHNWTDQPKKRKYPKFVKIKENMKRKGKFNWNERNKIEKQIANEFGIS